MVIKNNKFFSDKNQLHLSQLMNMMDNIVLILDQNGLVQEVNQIGITKYGLFPDKIYNRPPREILRFSNADGIFTIDEELSTQVEKFKDRYKRKKFKNKQKRKKFNREKKSYLSNENRNENENEITSFFNLKMDAPNGLTYRVNCNLSLYGLKKISSILLITDITEVLKSKIALKENEERFRMILEEGPIAIMVVNSNGKPGYINPFFEKLSGYNKAELTPFDFTQVVAPEDKKIASGFLKNLFKQSRGKRRQEIVLNSEFKIRRKTGENRIVNVTASPIQNESGEIAFGVLMLEDITEKENSARKLIKAKRKLELYSKKLEHQVEIRSSELINKNKVLERTIEELQNTQSHLVQAEKMAVLGNLIAGIAHEINSPVGILQSSILSITDDLEYSIDHLPELIRSLDPSQYYIWHKIFQKAIKNQNNAFSSVELRKRRKEIFRFLTERNIDFKRNFPALLVNCGLTIENIDEYKILLELEGKEEMIRTASKLSEISELVNTVDIASDRISKVIQALQKYSHSSNSNIENDDKHRELCEINLQDGIETVLTLYQYRIKDRIRIIKNYESNDNVVCNPDEINQVWTNLINNAIYAIPRAGTITITIHSADKYMLVSILDTGSGILEQYQDDIFKPFFTTKPRGEGSGLGLDIVKKIVEKHNGSITLSRSDKNGSEFTVRLPKSVRSKYE